MQFKHPEILFALLLLIIPIIVHLFQLQRFVKVPFTNVKFLKNIEKPSAKKIFDAAIRGDELSNIVVDKIAYALGYACHMVSLVVNPEVIVFGGGVSKAGDFLFDKIRKEFKEYKFHAVQNTKIIGAELGNDAGMYGAAYMVANA